MTNNFKLILDLHRAKLLVVLTGIYILAETLRFDLLTYTIISYLILVIRCNKFDFNILYLKVWLI